MVGYKGILASNALIDETTTPRIALFVGSTSTSVGKLTVNALARVGTSTKIYIIGRKSAEQQTREFIQELNGVNAKAELIWVEGDISLLAEVKRVCDVIKDKESALDLLFLNAGFAPLGERVETSEGIEISQSLEFYSRMHFIQQLLPLLNRAKAPRVVSVLGGGMETTKINLDDLDLKQPGNFSFLKAQPQYLTMHSLALEQVADENPNITIIHSWPGWVQTGNLYRTFKEDTWMGWLAWLTIGQLLRVFGLSNDESGQRHLFACTSAAFGGQGVPWTGQAGLNVRNTAERGLFLVSFWNNSGPNKAMDQLRGTGKAKVWHHTQSVLKPYT